MTQVGDAGLELVGNIRMATNLFDFEKVKLSPNFVVKTFKDSVYVGEVD